MTIKGWKTGVMGLVVLAGLSAGLMAQNNQQNRGFGQQGQNLDPQEMARQQRQSMNDRIKEALGATDEEWAVLGPRIEKIQGLSNDVGGNSSITGMIRMLARGARGGGGGQLNARTMAQFTGGSTAMAQRMDDLQQAIDNPAMPESEIKSRLAAVRAEREKIREELKKARADLVQLVTQRQEAILFSLGIVE